MPLTKTQMQYLSDKLRSAQNKAQNDFCRNNPTKWDDKTIEDNLRNHGFEVKPGYGIERFVTLPKTKAMLDNEERYNAFVKASQAALGEAIDMIHLGGADEAMAMLRQFTDKLAELAR